MAASSDFRTSAIFGAFVIGVGGRKLTGSGLTGGSGFTGERWTSVRVGFVGGAGGRFNLVSGLTAAFAATGGAGLADFFGAAGTAFAVTLPRSPETFAGDALAFAGASFAAFEPEVFADTGFADALAFGAGAVFPLMMAAETALADLPVPLDGLAVARTGFTTAFAATTGFRDVALAAGFATDFTLFATAFAGGDFFEASVFATAALAGTALTGVFALAATLVGREVVRLLEVSLEGDFTEGLVADLPLPAFAGEFLIESLCFTIL